MNKEDKYYTPSIEEFHVGFEYEELEFIYTDKGWYTEKKNKFVKKVFVGTNYLESYYLTERVKRGLFNSSIRVKYLDKEDIEDLGFKYDNNAEPIPSRRDWEVPKLDEFELPLAFIKDTQDINGKAWYLYLYKDGAVWIEYIKDCCGMGYLFKGTIKNKSELKVLLKQIGVE